MALQLWHCEGMHAATCLSARVSTNKEVASAALFLATAVCWIALASFSAPTWGKSLKCLGLSFSFSVLGCCGGWCFLWVGTFFATGPVAHWMWRCPCSLGAPQDGCKFNGWRFDSSLVRIYFGAQVFSGGGFVVLRWLLTFYEHLAKELVLSYFTIITIIIFNNINT